MGVQGSASPGPKVTSKPAARFLERCRALVPEPGTRRRWWYGINEHRAGLSRAPAHAAPFERDPGHGQPESRQAAANRHQLTFPPQRSDDEAGLAGNSMLGVWSASVWRGSGRMGCSPTSPDGRLGGRRSSSAPHRPRRRVGRAYGGIARRSGSSRATSEHRSGLTTRTSTSPTTSVTQRCRRRVVRPN